MKIQGHLQDYPLSVLLEVLADRRESGCLKIAFKPEPAILYFKHGQLVAARLALLKDSEALRLALSMDSAPFDFDNDVTPPPRIAIYERQKAYLTPRPAAQQNTNGERGTERRGALAVRQFPAPSKSNLLELGLVQSPVNAMIPGSESQPLMVPADPRLKSSSSLQAFFRRFATPKLLRTVAVICIFAVPAAVGLTVRLRKMTPTPVNASSTPDNAPVSQPPASMAAVTTPLPEAEPSPTHSPVLATREFATPNEREEIPEPTKTVGESEPSKVISEITNVKAEAESRAADSATISSSVPKSRPDQTKKTIVVEVQIEQGRVTGAWIKNSQKGEEAFEAAALRMIRQRRFAKELTTTDSVSVEVTVNK